MQNYLISKRCYQYPYVHDIPLSECAIPAHKYYDGLLPFFMDNQALQFTYDTIIEKEMDPQRKADVSKYKAELAEVCNSHQHKDTYFHSEGAPFANSSSLMEDEWTVRLFHCVKPYVPKNVTLECTYSKGPVFKG